MSILVSRRAFLRLLCSIILVTNCYYHSSKLDNHDMSSDCIKNKETRSGFAACLLVLDDTIRLLEWIAYHFTTLPLTSLVIAIDPKTSDRALSIISTLPEKWRRFGLNITLWPSYPYPKMYNYTPSLKRRADYVERQQGLASSCVHHFLDRASEKYLLLTDNDEFVSFNFILPGEVDDIHNISKNSIFYNKKGAPSVSQRLNDRVLAIPIREHAFEYFSQNVKTGANYPTIQTFIEEETTSAKKKESMMPRYFPSPSGCTRIVGMTYGIDWDEVDNASFSNKKTSDRILMTKKYVFAQKYPTDHFSKVMIELTKISRDRDELKYIESIHNPFPKLCGFNGPHSSGQDFSGSILKLAHYVGSLEAYLERGMGKGTVRSAQNIETWLKKHNRSAPYTILKDETMGFWVEHFVRKVGGDDVAQELLFKPLRNQINHVRLNLNISYEDGIFLF